MARVIGTLASSGDTQAPTQPQNLSATAINRQRVDLSWTASTDNVGVTGYQIFRDGSPLDTSGTTTYSDTSASASTTYSYTVVAFDAAGNSSAASAGAAATTPANASPTWDTIPSQDLIVGDSYTLDLSDLCSDADADTIEYSIAAGTLPSGLALIGSIISGTPTTAGQSPTVTVRADDGFDEVDEDIVFETFTTDATAPPVPSGLSATAVSLTQVNVSWSASTDAAGGANEFVSGTQDYRVYRSTDGSNFSLRTTVASTSYSDTGLSGDTTYYYKVAARDVELNESAQSSAVNATTTSVSTVQQDWLNRISGAGVVWYHDFSSQAEVDNFRRTGQYGNDPLGLGRPDTVVWNADDGITGGCLQINREAGTDDPSNWWRMFSPLNAASTGRAVADPGANGTIPRESFTPTDGGSQTLNWEGGFYGHSNYHSVSPGQFDGTEYYLQIRCKMDPNRIAGLNANEEGGKFFYFTFTHHSNSTQEIVTVSGQPRGTPVHNIFDMYRSGGGGMDQSPDNTVSVSGNQPGSEYDAGVGDGLCRFDNNGGRLANCWQWPDEEEWITLLYHVTLGLDDNADTQVEVFAARDGETSYSKIWGQSGIDLSYENGYPFGHNALIVSGYMNGQNITTPFYHRVAQIIFSKNTIACPQAYEEATALSTAAAALSAGQSALFTSSWTGGDIPTGDDLNWINKFFYDHARQREFSAAKLQGVHTAMTHHWLSEVDNIWVAENCNFSASGHVFDFIAYDYATGVGYLAPGGGKDNRLWSSTWGGGSLSAPVVATSSASPDLDAIMHGSTKQFTDGAAAIDFHPNLFGAGDGGVVVVCNRGVGGWRKSTDTWHIIIPFSVYGNIDTTPACVYSHALDAVIVSGATGTQVYRINNSTTYTQSGSGGLSAAPIPLGPDRGGENRGCIVDDPLRLGGWYVLEKVGSQRVWQYSGGSWSLKGYTHPFVSTGDSPQENWMVASCYGLGIFKSLERTGGQPRQRLWRPG